MDITQQTSRQDDEFRKDAAALAPQIRAYAISLCRDGADADDLIQDTMLKAWTFRGQYHSGTVLRAWIFTIMRHQFLDDRRRSWRVSQLDQTAAENTLHAVSNPSSILELDEMRRALTALPTEQREAVMLIGAGGYAYDEAAEICGANVGTIKSRASRGRGRLREILKRGAYAADGLPCGAAMAMILAQVDQISRRAVRYA